MSIQNVNMAVPVGRPSAAQDKAIESEVDAELEALRERCVQAVRQRMQPARTARQRDSRQHQFDTALKGIVKRLASAACNDIEDRDAKAAMRVRLYTDLSTVAQSICTEVDDISRHQRRKQLWARCAFALVPVALGIAAWYWWLQPMQ